MQRCNKILNLDLFQTRNFSEPDSCLCTTSFCNAALVSTKFSFPFVIEFSLVASCLLIVTWGNIGKQPPPCECIVKPSYKFYKAYTGIVHDTFFVTSPLFSLLKDRVDLSVQFTKCKNNFITYSIN